MAKLKTTTPAPTPAPQAPAAAGGWTPNFAEETRANLPRLPATPPRLLMAHPERWTVMQGHVIPLMGSLKLQAGVNRVKQTADGRFQKLEAEAALEEQGWRVIPADIDGPGTSYIRQVAPGVFLSRWERAYPGSTHTDVDEVGYAEWCRSLIDRGVVAPPAPYVLELLRAKRQREHDELRDKVATTPSVKPTLDRLAADIAAVDAEVARYGRGEAATGQAVGLADLGVE